MVVAVVEEAAAANGGIALTQPRVETDELMNSGEDLLWPIDSRLIHQRSRCVHARYETELTRNPEATQRARRQIEPKSTEALLSAQTVHLQDPKVPASHAPTVPSAAV